MRRSARRRLGSLLLCATALLVAPAAAWAQAQASPEDRARADFEEGKRLRDGGDWQAACAKFAQANATFSTGGTMFVLADCEERSGRPASARALYQRVLADPGSQSNPERMQIAEQRVRAIDAQLAAGPRSPRSSEPAAALTERVMNPIPGAIVLGIGGAALIAGGVLGGLALSEMGAVRDSCTDDVCPPSQQTAAEGAEAKALAADITLVTGGAAAVVGIVLLLVLETDREARPTVTPTGSGLRVQF